MDTNRKSMLLFGKEKPEDAPKLVVFNSRLGPPNVRITLFGEFKIEAHAHVLEEHSQVLFGLIRASTRDELSTPFLYEWVSQFAEDGITWNLVAADNIQTDGIPYQNFDKAMEAKGFTNILRAFYRQPLEIDGRNDLNYMTEVAKFYGCLPIVSYALDATLAKSNHNHQYLNNIPPADGQFLLASAALLRNVSLFKECVVFCAGPWKDPDFCEKTFRRIALTDRHFKLVSSLHSRITESIASLHWDLICGTTSDQDDDDKTKEEKASWRHTMEVTAEKLKSRSKYHDIPRAAYYRSLLDEDFGPFGCGYIRESLKNVLESRLPLNKRAEAGKGVFDEYFISHEVWDGELPWDVNDTSMDW